MAATYEDVHEWLLRGQQNGATHVIVACDTFDMEDYPVYVQSDQQVQAEIEKVQGHEMQKVMEVYNLALPLEAQLSEWDWLRGKRAWNL